MIDIDLTKLTSDNYRVHIPGYDGYEADIHGNIWSVTSNWRGYGCRQLKTKFDRYGYLRVRVYRNGKRVDKQAHLLVCLAFHGPKPEGMQTRHLDDVKTNNIPSNLKWGTQKENSQDAVLNNKNAKGSKHGMAKLNESDVMKIKYLLKNGEEISEIASFFSVTKETIYNIKTNKRWTHVN